MTDSTPTIDPAQKRVILEGRLKALDKVVSELNAERARCAYNNEDDAELRTKARELDLDRIAIVGGIAYALEMENQLQKEKEAAAKRLRRAEAAQLAFLAIDAAKVCDEAFTTADAAFRRWENLQIKLTDYTDVTHLTTPNLYPSWRAEGILRARMPNVVGSTSLPTGGKVCASELSGMAFTLAREHALTLSKKVETAPTEEAKPEPAARRKSKKA